MSKRNGEQKGAQMHAEGQHGEKTHARFLEQLHEGREAQPLSAGETRTGGSHIAEGRDQNDEADRNSHKNRTHRDVARGRREPDAERGMNGSPPQGK